MKNLMPAMRYGGEKSIHASLCSSLHIIVLVFVFVFVFNSCFSLLCSAQLEWSQLYGTVSSFLDHTVWVKRTFVLQVSKRSAGSVALSKVGGGEDGAEGGGGDQLLPDQVGAGEALPDQAVKLIWDQIDQEQFQESARKLSPLLKQGRKKDFTSYSIFS